MHKNDIINQSLGIPVESDIIQQSPREIILTPDGRQLENDIELARQNIIDVVEKGADALDEMIDIAKASQHPKGFEVVATLMKTLVDGNKEILNIHKTKKELAGDSVSQSADVINNNQYNLTTAQMIELVKNKDV